MVNDSRTSPIENPPSQCEWRGCERNAEWEVHFEKPTDYVYYCTQHAELQVSRLRHAEMEAL